MDTYKRVPSCIQIYFNRLFTEEANKITEKLERRMKKRLEHNIAEEWSTVKDRLTNDLSNDDR